MLFIKNKRKEIENSLDEAPRQCERVQNVGPKALQSGSQLLCQAPQS